MLRSLLRLWALALMLSAVLAAAGERWPESLPIEPIVVVVLLLAPALVVLIWLGFNWGLPAAPDPGSGERGESQHP